MRVLFKIIKAIISYPFVSSKFDENWINSFADWFGGIPGFKQQMLFMVGWIAIVIFYPQIDPNMLHLMAFLTIYSGITQPMLAIGNTRSVMMQMKLLEGNLQQLQVMLDMIKAVQALNVETHKQLEEISEEIEDLDENRHE